MFLIVIISPLFDKLSSGEAPSDAVCTITSQKFPVGVPPPNTTNALFAGIIVCAGNICLGSSVPKEKASNNLYPLISKGASEILKNSINSS